MKPKTENILEHLIMLVVAAIVGSAVCVLVMGALQRREAKRTSVLTPSVSAPVAEHGKARKQIVTSRKEPNNHAFGGSLRRSVKGFPPNLLKALSRDYVGGTAVEGKGYPIDAAVLVGIDIALVGALIDDHFADLDPRSIRILDAVAVASDQHQGNSKNPGSHHRGRLPPCG